MQSAHVELRDVCMDSQREDMRTDKTCLGRCLAGPVCLVFPCKARLAGLRLQALARQHKVEQGHFLYRSLPLLTRTRRPAVWTGAMFQTLE